MPYLRRKVGEGGGAAPGFDPASYAGRALLNVLENYPRDELFQIDEDTLYRFALEILNLSERPRIRVLARPDEFNRFVSLLVFMPKDRYDTQVRRRVGEFLAEALRRTGLGRLSGLSRRARWREPTTSSAATKAKHRDIRSGDAGTGHRRDRADLGRRLARRARRHDRRPARPSARGALCQRLQGRLPGGLRRRGRDRRHRDPGAPVREPAARGRPLPRARARTRRAST